MFQKNNLQIGTIQVGFPPILAFLGLDVLSFRHNCISDFVVLWLAGLFS